MTCFPTIRIVFFLFFHGVEQEPESSNVNRTFRNPVKVHNPLNIEKKTIMIALNLDLLIIAFLALGEVGDFQWID